MHRRAPAMTDPSPTRTRSHGRRPHGWPAVLAAVVVTVSLLAAGCSDDDPDVPDASSGADGTEAPDPQQGSGAVSPEAVAQLDWFVSTLAPDAAPVSATDYEERFAESFRDAVPHDALVQTNAGFQAAGPYHVVETTADGSDALVATIEAADATRLEVSLAVDADGRIEGLLIQPASLADTPASVEEAVDRLGEMGTVRFVAATVDGEGCTEDVGEGADEVAPLGSIFKLYVLGAVADAIAAGTLAWDTPLTVTAEVKSLPSGQLQDVPDGTVVTVQEAAGLMISISDNTATDLLMATVGRDAVESAQAGYGHTDPSLNTPMLTTLELFALKAADDATQQQWLEGDETARRGVLDALAEVGPADIPLDMFDDGPIHPDTLEWFATPLDVCRALATLMARSTEPGLGPVAEILTANPGIPPVEGMWASVAFKGGSEPGLAAAAWLTTAPDGSSFAVVGSVVDPEEPVDEVEAIQVMAAARDLLGSG